MSDEANPQAAVVPPPAAEPISGLEAIHDPEVKVTPDTNGSLANGISEPSKPEELAIPSVVDAPAPAEPLKDTNDNQITNTNFTQDTSAHEDLEMAGTNPDVPAAQEQSAEPTTADGPASAGKQKARRKSGGVPEHKGKKLNKKASKAKLTHSDAKPGDHFYVRLKGYPLWPAVVCDESMLPSTLIKARPVAAMRDDGTYRADFEDGGPKVKDRSFPVMYLHTNEFGWIPNYDLLDLDFDEVGNIPANMRKDLAEAHRLASEQHDLDYYKKILKDFQDAREADLAAKAAAKAEKKAKKAAAKKEKKPAKPIDDGETDEDVDMADAPGEVDSEAAGMVQVEEVVNKKKRKSKEQDGPDSVKKPRSSGIKLTISATPKATNGTSTPKSAKETSTKPTKQKTKKSAVKALETPEVVVPKEPELSSEEKRAKKEKEILFLRHKLQKGLLTRDQDPKEDEMKQMSEYISKLEAYAELEVSIIRATKINKVLKAILKLGSIPKEEEFMFKPRSQSLLDKWNKLLASEQGTPAAAPANTNGATAEAKTEAEESKASPTEPTYGSKESIAKEKAEEKPQVAALAVEQSVPEKNKVPGTEGTAPAPTVEEPPKDSILEPTPVEASA